MYSVEAGNSMWITLTGRSGHTLGLDGVAWVLVRAGERMENGRDRRQAERFHSKPTESLTVAATWLDFIA